MDPVKQILAVPSPPAIKASSALEHLVEVIQRIDRPRRKREPTILVNRYPPRAHRPMRTERYLESSRGRQ